MCEPGKPGLEDHSLTTGHNTFEHRLGTQGDATATTWVHKAALSRGVRQVDFLRLVEGRGGQAYCLCSSQALQPRRSSLILQLGHWSPSGPQNKPSNTHRLQEIKADKDTYGD